MEFFAGEIAKPTTDGAMQVSLETDLHPKSCEPLDWETALACRIAKHNRAIGRIVRFT
jgi:hypothetical protein